MTSAASGNVCPVRNRMQALECQGCGAGSPYCSGAVRTERRCSAPHMEGGIASELPELPDFLELRLLS